MSPKKRFYIASSAVAGLVAFGTIGLKLMTGHDWFDCFFFTLYTLTTIGYGELPDMDREAKYFTVVLIILGVSTIGYALSAAAQAVLESELLSAFGKRKMFKDINKLTNHFIVCGAGRIGSRVIREIARSGHDFVISFNPDWREPRLPREPREPRSPDAPAQPREFGDYNFFKFPRFGGFMGTRLGITIEPLTGQLAEYFGVKSGQGILVTEVRANAPAAKAGLKAGDVITAIDGKKVESVDMLVEAITEKEEGQMTLTILRNRVEQNLTVTIEKRRPSTRGSLLPSVSTSA